MEYPGNLAEQSGFRGILSIWVAIAQKNARGYKIFNPQILCHDCPFNPTRPGLLPYYGIRIANSNRRDYGFIEEYALSDGQCFFAEFNTGTNMDVRARIGIPPTANTSISSSTTLS